MFGSFEITVKLLSHQSSSFYSKYISSHAKSRKIKSTYVLSKRINPQILTFSPLSQYIICLKMIRRMTKKIFIILAFIQHRAVWGGLLLVLLMAPGQRFLRRSSTTSGTVRFKTHEEKFQNIEQQNWDERWNSSYRSPASYSFARARSFLCPWL